MSLASPAEISYWTERLSCDEEELREAVEVAGTSMMKVLRYIAVSRGAT